MRVTDATPPIALGAEDWAIVTRLLREQVPALEVWAFGSRARRDAKPYSDLDLALITEEPLTLDQMARIAEAFETSDLTINVDLVDWASTGEAFRKIIQRDKVAVQHVL
jgi:uncharacterized protein